MPDWIGGSVGPVEVALVDIIEIYRIGVNVATATTYGVQLQSWRKLQSAPHIFT